MLTILEHLKQNRSFTHVTLVKNRVKRPVKSWCNSSLCAKEGPARVFTLGQKSLQPSCLSLLLAPGVCRQYLTAGHLLPCKGARSQSAPTPPCMEKPPQQLRPALLSTCSHSTWATHTVFHELLLRPVIKDLQQWGFNKLQMQPRLVLHLQMVSSYTISLHKAEFFPLACPPQTQRAASTAFVSQLLSPSFPRPWLSKPPLCSPLDSPNNNSQSKMMHLMWALPAHPSQADGFLLSPSQLLFSPVYNSLFGLFCRALGSQLAPCLWPIFPQFRLLILFSSSKCKIGFGCVVIFGFFSFLECGFPDFTKVSAPKPSQNNSVFLGFALHLFFEGFVTQQKSSFNLWLPQMQSSFNAVINAQFLLF